MATETLSLESPKSFLLKDTRSVLRAICFVCDALHKRVSHYDYFLKDAYLANKDC